MCRVGVLALQGAFREHVQALTKCGVHAYDVRLPGQLKAADGLIIPGGESTVIDKLIKKYDFKGYLDHFFKAGKPLMGTCAGLIMLAGKVLGQDMGWGYINLTAERNAYGRQIDSFEQDIHINLNCTKGQDFKAIFIRAPKIVKVGAGVQILGMLGKEAVLVRQNNVVACSFHPELGQDLRIHQYFVQMIKKNKRE